ncbi:MAG: hypothetical protein PF569_06240 [Candidatus Woesearchaeota archaeon]|jgi:hypothetical protein|nr:hypothetical protein [Candidatus Woesearchaeota archaeon]
MNKDETKVLIRNLINKIYNSADITNDILDEIEEDLKIISEYLQETRFSRELGVFISSAREQKNQIGKNSFKFLFLSNLEKRYQRLCREE